MLDLFLANVISAPILFFILGITAGSIRSDLSIPDPISRYFSFYLMMAIGFKGGVALSETSMMNADVILTILAGLLVGFLQPFLGFFFLRKTTSLDLTTAAALAAHYGSISMVTFVTAVSFLDLNAIVYAGYIIGVLAIMEAPAIFSGLFLAANSDRKNQPIDSQAEAPNSMMREILTNGSIVILMGSLIIGWATGTDGLDTMSGFIVDPFQGILSIFLLDMGLTVARKLQRLKGFTLPLVAFGIYMPLIGSVIGTILAKLIGLDVGTGLLFIVLTASASYIAVPAAMRVSLPEANEGIYVPMSLAITFPFNITVGIPLYYAMADWAL